MVPDQMRDPLIPSHLQKARAQCKGCRRVADYAKTCAAREGQKGCRWSRRWWVKSSWQIPGIAAFSLQQRGAGVEHSCSPRPSWPAVAGLDGSHVTALFFQQGTCLLASMQLCSSNSNCYPHLAAFHIKTYPLSEAAEEHPGSTRQCSWNKIFQMNRSCWPQLTPGWRELELGQKHPVCSIFLFLTKSAAMKLHFVGNTS